MGHFIRQDFVNGQLRCYVCNKLLLIKTEGEYEIELICPRCKTYMKLKTIEPIPFLKDKPEITNAQVTPH